MGCRNKQTIMSRKSRRKKKQGGCFGRSRLPRQREQFAPRPFSGPAAFYAAYREAHWCPGARVQKLRWAENWDSDERLNELDKAILSRFCSINEMRYECTMVQFAMWSAFCSEEEAEKSVRKLWECGYLVVDAAGALVAYFKPRQKEEEAP